MVGTKLRYTYLAKGRYWRFRHPKVGDAALPANPGDAAFHARYSELLARVNAAPVEPDRQSFAWLIARYRKSAEFGALADSTQLDYGKTLDLLGTELGAQPFRLTTRTMIKAVRDDYAATPRKAHKLKQMLSRLYSWADEGELVPAGFNPAAGVKRLKVKAKPYTPWSDEEIALFLSRAPGHVVTPVMLALHTGQRREDIVTMTWKDYQGAYVRVRQSKTGEPLDIACHAALRLHLDGIRGRKGVVICTNEAGRAYNANMLSQALRRAVAGIAEMPDRSMHGLRYAAAARLEEAGCTLVEITSVIGHRTYQMGMKYAGQRKASKAAADKQEKQA